MIGGGEDEYFNTVNFEVWVTEWKDMQKSVKSADNEKCLRLYNK